MSSSPQVHQPQPPQYYTNNNDNNSSSNNNTSNVVTTAGSGMLGTAASMASVQYSYSFATQTSEYGTGAGSGAAAAAGGGGVTTPSSVRSQITTSTSTKPPSKQRHHHGHGHHHGGHGHSNRLASPVVSACRHLLQPNGSILGSAVADAVLPNFPDLCSALPVDSFGHHVALWGVDGRRPLTHSRLRQFILQEFGPTLHEYGFGRGQRIALVLPNGPELAMAILATAHWASCVPLKGDGQLAELKKDLQAARVDMILGEARGDNTAALQDMARALSIPFFGMTPSPEEVGLFTFGPMSLPNKVLPKSGGPSVIRNVDRVNMQTALYEHVMMISNPDSSSEEGASCCGTMPRSTYGGASGDNSSDHNHHKVCGSSTYNYLSNDHDDEVLVLFTSGTTGNKKLVSHLLGDMMIAAACIAVSWNLSPDDVNCNLMPLFHVGGICRQVFAPVLSAGSVICCPSFDPHLFWQLLLSQHPSQLQEQQQLQLQLMDGATSSQQLQPQQKFQQQQYPKLPPSFSWYYAAPTMHSVILSTFHSTPEFIERSPIGTFSIRMIANAAGGLLPSLAQKLRTTFGGPSGSECNVLPSYGMTECMPISSPPYTYQLEKPGTSGVAVGPEIKIFNGQLEPSKPGKEGNICVRGRPCFKGYGVTASSGSNTSGPSHGGKTTSAHIEANKNSFLAGGWFNTGDLGYLDEDGYLYITGRSKEVINRGGEIISPLEVEEEIAQHSCIAACAAFSAPHQVLQEVVGVVLVHRPGACKLDLPTLHQFLQDKLTPAKWPQCLVYMDALPKSHTNKLLRVKLGQRLNLPELTDTMFPIERTFEATCPPQGTPVGVSIPSEAVEIDHEYIQDILRQELGAVGSSMDDDLSTSNSMFDDPTMRTSTVRQQAQPIDSESQLFVTPHPSRVGSVTAHVYKLDPKEVINASLRLFDGYMQPSHVCCYTTRISLANIKKYPERTDAVQAHLNGENSHAQVVTDPVVRQMQELVQQIVDMDCLPAPDSSFFHIGGSSLLASQLASRIRKSYQVQFSGTDVFKHNTCISMAKRIQEQRPEYSENSSDRPGTDPHVQSSDEGDSQSKTQGNSRFPTVDLQKVPFDMFRLLPYNNCLSAMIQLIPMLGFFPLYQFSRFFLFFMSLLGILHNVPGEANILKFIVTLVAFHFFWVLLSPLVFVLIKWIVIGRYQAGRYPIWGSYYLRWWIVDVCRKILGKGFWGSHEHLLVMYYRMLGAKIGKNAKISLEADIAEYDLVEIGEGSMIEYSTMRGFGVDNGAMILGPVRLGAGSSLGVRSVVAPHTAVPDQSHVGPGTSSYEVTPGDENHPQHMAYHRKATQPEPAWYMQAFIASPILFLVDTFSHIPAMTVLYFLVTMHIRQKGDNAFHTVGDLLEWLCEPKRIPYYIGIRVARSIVAPFFYMAAAILVKWIVIGKFKEGPRDITDQWQLTRHWLSSRLFCRENMQEVTDLLGRHYEPVSVLYRLLGAKVGKRVFWPGHQFVFSGEFDLLEIGDDVVFGSRGVVLCSTVDQNCRVTFCAGSNISDNTVVLPGGVIGKNTVLASNTVCPAGRYLPEASIYLGSRGGEPIMLEMGIEANAKEVMLSSEVDREKLPMVGDASTLRPFGKAVYTQGGATYFVWPVSLMMAFKTVCSILFEAIHALPLLGALHISGGVLYGFPVSDRDYDSYNYRAYTVYTTMFVVFLGTHAIRIGLCFAIEIAAKWLLMGKRMEGRYNWDTSTYGQRWELYQIVSQIRKLHRVTTLDFIAGTPFMSAYFRTLGSQVGNDCCLYPAGGDPYMPEPDLVSFGDRCVVDVASVVCHLNTRGNFELVKIRCDDHVTLRARSRIQQGVHVEAGGMLLEKTLALTGEVIDSDSVWQGAPARIVHTYPRGTGISPSTSFGHRDGGYQGMMMEMI